MPKALRERKGATDEPEGDSRQAMKEGEGDSKGSTKDTKTHEASNNNSKKGSYMCCSSDSHASRSKALGGSGRPLNAAESSFIQTCMHRHRHISSSSNRCSNR